MENELLTIEQIKAIAAPIAKRYGARRLALFGSYARGEETPHSDVDLFLDGGKIRSLLQYYTFVNELEDAFGRHVDVVMEGSSDKDLLRAIAKDEVLLFS